MKKQLQKLLYQSLQVIKSEGTEISIEKEDIKIEYTRDLIHGDFASNIAMLLAKKNKCKPRELANKISENLPQTDFIARTEIAGPGFINFFLNQNAYLSVVLDILEKGTSFGNSNIGNNQPILIEFVSANPTGPLHIGHGRGAAYGDAISNLLNKIGFDVDREYYVNDSGRQMNILTLSIWLRYLELMGKKINFPEKAYQGDYIKKIAHEIKEKYADEFLISNIQSLNLPNNKNDEEEMLDSMINSCINELGEEKYTVIHKISLDSILTSIKKDLSDFGVTFDKWFSENSLMKTDSLNKCVSKLEINSKIYEKDGAKWFRSSDYGDEKDRVIMRENGQSTYFASDIAYHVSKYERKYKKIINIWGADHHGYIPRVKASIEALGYSPKVLEILLVQFAALFRGKKKLQMSTRSGQFVTLKELVMEVGKDAARFFYVMRKSEQHLDFDIELAKSESNDNPVYYIQYAHARICSVFNQMKEKKYAFTKIKNISDLSVLDEPQEISLLSSLAKYPDVIESSAITYEPHQLAYYLKELANYFHTYYNANQFLVDDEKLRNARLSLIDATRQVIKDGLLQLGVSSPEKM